MSDRRHLIVVVLSAVALLAFVFGVLRPRSSEAADLREQVAAAQAEERTLTDRLASLQQLEAGRAQLDADLAEMQEYLPQHAHIVRLVRLLNRASKIAGVDLRQIAPSVPSPNEAVRGSRLMTASLIVTGVYDRIESFAAQLEQMSRAVKVTSINFAPQQEEGSTRTMLTATLLLEMYTWDPAGTASEPEATNDEEEAA